jgi:hypothetical protein
MRLTHADVRAELVRLLGQDAGVRGVIGDIAEAGPKAREARVMERIFGL